MVKILLIDPRPASYEAMASLLRENSPVWGVEFTLPKLAPLLAGNIDGQHSADAPGRAAIELAAWGDLPQEIYSGTTYAIVRPDPDALGAIAVQQLRNYYLHAYGEDLLPSPANAVLRQRITYITEQDAFQFGGWQCPADPQVVFFGTERDLFAALTLICTDRALPIEERYQRIQDWLNEGQCEGLDVALAQVQREKQATWEDSEILLHQGNLIVLRAHTLGATQLAYCYAPVAVIANDQFRFPGTPGTHLKYTICQFQSGRYADLVGAARALNELEQSGGSWGGSPAIIGSPQGVSSTLTVEQVVEVVQQFLK